MNYFKLKPQQHFSDSGEVIQLLVFNLHVLSSPGYVEPRNLPSTGFFPFLQTLMCNTDSNCHNNSRQVDTTTSQQGNKRYHSYLCDLLVTLSYTS